MKKSFFVLLTLTMALTIGLATTPARAERVGQPGSQCGLTDSTADTAWIDLKRTSNLSKDVVVDALTTLEKQQIIIAANYAVQDNRDEMTFKSAREAIAYLQQGSESSDLFMVRYKVNGKKVTEVVSYPGGNAYGTIFLSGTTQVIAFDHDTDVYCK